MIREKVLGHVAAVRPGVDEDQVLAAIDRGTYEGDTGGRCWTLDPIDGTIGFLRGDQYAVALALLEEGRVVLGVLGCPNLPLDAAQDGASVGCLFLAVQGEGTVMRGLDDDTEHSIYVSDVAGPEQATFCESVEAGHSSHKDAARIADILGVTALPLRMDSQCKYAATARGDAEIYLRLPTHPGYLEKIWDHAAGSLVVTEAGGQVSDIYGRPLEFSQGRTLRNNTGVVATNGKLHEEVAAAIQTALGVDGDDQD